MSSVGQAVGGIVGAVVGFFTPLGPVYGAQIGMMVGGVLDPPRTEGPRLEDLTTQTSVYGAFIPRLYGTTAVTGNVLWIQGDKLIEHSVESDGKGGPVVTNYEYFATFAVGLCEGPIDGVRRIWIGGQLWYDAGSDDLSTIIASNENAGTFTLYPGTDTQEADPLIQADRGAANVPAYRGIAYLVFNELPLKDYSNTIAGAQVKVEVVKSGTSVFPVVVDSRDMADPSSFHATDGVFTSSSITSVSTTEFERTDDVELVTAGMSRLAFTRISKIDGHNNTLAIPCRNDFEYAVQQKQASGSVDVTGLYRGNTLISRPVYPPIGTDTYYSVSAEFVSTKDYFFFVGGNAVVGQLWIARYKKNPMPDGMYADVFYDLFALGHTSAAIFASDDTLWAHVPDTGDLLELSFDLDMIASHPGFPGTTGRKFVVEDRILVVDNEFGVPSAATEVKAYSIPGFAQYGQTVLASGQSTYSKNIWAVGGGLVYCNGAFISLYPRLASGAATLSAIVESECLQSGLLTAGDLDVTELTDQVRGYRISNLAPLRGGIDQLRKAWPFDAIQHGYQIKFKKRGGASVATITEGELDARAAGANPGVRISNTREMDLIMPQQLTVQYMDATREYDVNVAEESR